MGETRPTVVRLQASLLCGSALAWYQISYQRSPTAIPRTWAEIRAALEKQFGVIQETRNAKGQAAHTGVERVSFGIYGYIPGHSHEYQKIQMSMSFSMLLSMA